MEELNKEDIVKMHWILRTIIASLLGVLCYFLSNIYQEFKEMNATVNEAVKTQGILIERLQHMDNRVRRNEEDIKELRGGIKY